MILRELSNYLDQEITERQPGASGVPFPDLVRLDKLWKNAETSFASIMNCHPEARCWPKDLPQYIGLKCTFVAFSRGFWPKSHDAPMKSQTFREILQPTSGQLLRIHKRFSAARRVVLFRRPSAKLMLDKLWMILQFYSGKPIHPTPVTKVLQPLYTD
jgi:hypothetical protein